MCYYAAIASSALNVLVSNNIVGLVYRGEDAWSDKQTGMNGDQIGME